MPAPASGAYMVKCIRCAKVAFIFDVPLDVSFAEALKQTGWIPGQPGKGEGLCPECQREQAAEQSGKET